MDSSIMKFPFYKKLIGICAVSIYCLISISGAFYFSIHTLKGDETIVKNNTTLPRPEDYTGRIFISMFLMLFELSCTVPFMYTVYSNICVKQNVNCYHQTSFVLLVTTHVVLFVLFLFCKGICYPLQCNTHLTRIIEGSLFFTIANFLFSLAVFGFHKIFCKCKVCNNIKEVKFTYLDETVYIFEEQMITSQFLLEKFRIILRDDETLSVKGKNVHTFYDSSKSICFYPGTYVVRLRKLEDEVKINYMNAAKMISEKTVFNEKQLRTWLNIDANGVLAIELTNGEIVHTFHCKNLKTSLNEGNYVVRILEFKPNQETQSTSAAHKEVTSLECTILEVD